MKTLKKSLALLLALAMCLSLCSVGAWADGEEDATIAAAIESWKKYRTGSVQNYDLEASFGTMLSVDSEYGNLDTQQYGIVKLDSSNFNSANDSYSVTFSTDSAEPITGYVGIYGGPVQPLARNIWLPLNFSMDNSNPINIDGTSKVTISKGTSATRSLTDSNYNPLSSYLSGAYVGFALASEITSKVNVTVTFTNIYTSNDVENATKTIEFTASSNGSGSGSDTPTVENPTSVTVLGQSWILSDSEKAYDASTNPYKLFLNGDRSSMELVAALTSAAATGEIEWSSGDNSIVTVAPSQENAKTAIVAAAGVGTTTVTAKVKGKNISDTITVVVVDKPAATVGETTYNTLADALATVRKNTTISVDTETTIGSIPIAAGSTVTTMNDTNAAAAQNTTKVTPRTLTITSGEGESVTTQTAKAYVVSSGLGDNEKKAVVTDVKVADDSGITNDAPVVENLVNVAQVLANAVAENSIDVSSISSMELRLKKTSENTSKVVEGTNNDDKAALQAAISNGKAFEVHPEAVVTTKTTEGSSTTTDTVTYDASKDLAEGASFTFKLHVSDNAADAGKTANLTHYHEEGGVWTATKLSGIVDSNGDVEITLNRFSYITVDGVDYEVCGTITDMTLVVGSDNKLIYTFSLNDAGKKLSNPQVKLKLDGVGYLNSVSESEFNASRDTVYTVSENNGVYTLTIKVFAMYMNAKVYVELWDGASQKAIESYSRSKYDVSGYESYKTAQTGLTFGYSLVEYLGYYAGAANNSNYTALYNAMIPYAEAAAAFRQN